MTKQKQIILKPRTRSFQIASPLSIDEQRKIYEGVIESKKQYGDFPGLDGYFKFDEQEGFKGSNPSYRVLIEQELAKQGQRTPTFSEAMQLDKKDLLIKGVYRDFGIAIYNNLNPNKDLAEKLIGQAKKRDWKLPILVPFSGLDFDKESRLYKFTDDDFLIIFGDEAIEELNRFDHKGNSGVRRLYRDSVGVWDANWFYLFYSGSLGRVDWKCAKGMRANLEAKAIQEIEQTAQKQAEGVLAEINSKKEKALALFK